MKKILNLGWIVILGAMTTLTPSCTKDLKDDVDEIKKQIETLATTTLLDSKIKAVETQLTTLVTNINNEIKATKDKITALEGQIPTLATKAELTALTSRVTALETWRVSVDTDLKNIKADLTAIRAEYKAGDDALLLKIKALEETHKGDIALIEVALKEASDARIVLDEKFSGLDTKLTTEIFRIDAQIKTILGDVTNMKADILANAAAIAAQALVIAENADAADRAIAETNAKIAANHSEYLEKVAQLVSQISALEAYDLELKAGIDNSETKADAAAEYAKLRNEIATQVGALQTIVDGVKSDLEAATAKLLTAESDITTLKSQMSGIDDKIATAVNHAMDGLESRIGEKITEDIRTAIEEEKTRCENAITTAITNFETVFGPKITLEITNAINAEVTARNNAITTEVAKETLARQTAINEINSKLDGENGLIAKVANLEVLIGQHASALIKINNDIAAIVGRIQAINFISEYADGKATIYSVSSLPDFYSDMALRFRVYPADKAVSLAALFSKTPENFRLNTNKVLTRGASETNLLKITSLETDPNRVGDIIVRACSYYGFLITPTSTYSVSLDVKTEVMEGTEKELENTSSNVFAIHHNSINQNDVMYTNVETEVGGSVNASEIIAVNNFERVVTLDKDYVVGVFNNSKYVKPLKDYLFHNYTTTFCQITINGSAQYTDITAAQNAAKAAGFEFDAVAKTVRIHPEAKSSMIGNTIEMEYSTLGNCSSVTVEIGTIEVTVEYEAVTVTWEEDLQKAGNIPFDLANIATETGYTKAELATEFAADNLQFVDVENDKLFAVRNQAGQDYFRLQVKNAVSWKNSNYENLVLKTTLNDKRTLKVIIKKVSLQLPTIELQKVPVRWSTDLTTMLVQGEYDQKVATQFAMTGDLTECFAPKTPLPLGVKMFFETVTAQNSTWDMESNNQTINIASYDPETDNTKLKVNVYLEFTAKTGNTTPFKEVVKCEQVEMLNVPTAPVNPLLDLTTIGTISIDQATSMVTYDLNDRIRVKDRVYKEELRQDKASPGRGDQRDYYITFNNNSYFDNSFASYTQFGLTDQVFAKGAVFTLGEMTYVDGGAVVENISRESIIKGFNATDLAKGVLNFNYKGIVVNKDVTIKIDVKLHNNWGVSNGSIPVTIKSTINK